MNMLPNLRNASKIYFSPAISFSSALYFFSPFICDAAFCASALAVCSTMSLASQGYSHLLLAAEKWFGLPRDRRSPRPPNISPASTLREVSPFWVYSCYARQRCQIASAHVYVHSSLPVQRHPSPTLSRHNSKSKIRPEPDQGQTVRVSSTSSTIKIFFPIKSCTPIVLKSNH